MNDYEALKAELEKLDRKLDLMGEALRLVFGGDPDEPAR